MSIHRASTYTFANAEEGEQAFADAFSGNDGALIYGRLNTPNMTEVETALAKLDEMEAAAVFASGMAAISTVALTFLKPGDVAYYSEPAYGGTEHLFKETLPAYGIHTVAFKSADDLAFEGNVKLIFVETPSNPTMKVTSVRRLSELRDECCPGAILAVDNTFLGPVFATPRKHGADLAVYSASKFLSGHSDIIAGTVSGSRALISQVKMHRTILGGILDPHACWLLNRSLYTLRLRMEQQQKNALAVVRFLQAHPAVETVYYPGLTDIEDFREEYTGNGSNIAFEIAGGKAEAFAFLNKLKVFHLAVSLGAVKSLIQHPSSMTHSGLAPEDKLDIGIKETLIRCSIGLEDPSDLIADLDQALA